MEPYADKIKELMKKLEDNPTEFNRDNLLLLLSECILDVLLNDKK